MYVLCIYHYQLESRETSPSLPSPVNSDERHTSQPLVAKRNSVRQHLRSLDYYNACMYVHVLSSTFGMYVCMCVCVY